MPENESERARAEVLLRRRVWDSRGERQADKQWRMHGAVTVDGMMRSDSGCLSRCGVLGCSRFCFRVCRRDTSAAERKIGWPSC